MHRRRKADRVEEKAGDFVFYEIQTGRPGALDALWRFYGEVCAAQEGSAYSPGWHFGVYPDREELAEHLAAGEVVCALCGERIAGAAVLTARDDPMYADAAWRISAEAEEVSTVHLFAVHPDFRGTGVSGALVESLLAAARRNGKRLARLDVVTGKLPAERLYQKHSFLFCEEGKVYYEDTGEICVRLYERELT